MSSVPQTPPAPRRRCGKAVIIAVVAVLVLEVVGFGVKRGIDTSHAVQSASNLRELGGSLLRYANDHGGQYPDRIGDLILGGYADPKWLIVPWGSASVADGKTPQAQADQINAGGHCSMVIWVPA